MGAMLIRDVPAQVYRRLKQAARRNGRSVSQEALVILEGALPPRPGADWPKPYKGGLPLTKAVLREARKGRASL
jgi:hypothetical protein